MRICAATVAVLMVAQARGDIVYSHFEVPPVTQSVVMPGWEVGEYVTLAGGAQQMAVVEFQVGALASGPGGEGNFTFCFYEDAGGVPGQLLRTGTQYVILSGVEPRRIGFSAELAVPSPLWVTVRYETGGMAGVILTDTPATVGALSPTRVFRQGGTGAWGSMPATEWMTMRLTSPPPPCYPNCDHSAIAPILNVNDFVCFMSEYAHGHSYANCDGSTVAPVLNVNDYVCFQMMYAAGCP
jgi:hypothetical protein